MYDYNDVVVLEEINVSYNPENREKIDLCVLNSFGWSEHLRQHIRLFKKNCLNDFYYTVFDVQFNEIENKKVEQVCIEENVSLVKIKFKNRDDKIRFLHHRLKQKLNYIYNDYVKKRGCKYYGMFHQDSYLVEDIDFIKQLDEYPCFGRVFYGNRNEEFEFENIREKNLWYLWEGFCFLKTEYFPNYTWMPNYPYSYCYEKTYKWGATGVLAYYDNLYKFDENKCNFETLGYAKNKRERINIRKTDMDLSNIIHPDWGKCVCEEIDHFGCFIHGNGTAYMRMELKEEIDKKQDIILSFLQTL